MHISIGCVRTVLVLILLVIAHISKTRPIFVSELEAEDQATGIADRSLSYGTFDSRSTTLPSKPSTGSDLKGGPVPFGQYIRVD